MITDLNKILIEWSYRTSDGQPDANNSAKLLILESVLNDFGWSREARAELLSTLMTEDDIVKHKDSGNVYTVKNHNPETQDIVKKNASEDEIEKAKGAEQEDTQEIPKQIKNVYLDGGCGAMVMPAGAGVLSSSQNKPAALAFIEYLHSTSAQEHFTNTVYEFPLVAGIEPNALLPDIDSLNSPGDLNWSALALWQEKAVELIAAAGF